MSRPALKKTFITDHNLLAVHLKPTDHRPITSAWRRELPYSPTKGYHDLTDIDKAATKVYAREPILLWAARHQLALASLNDHEN